MSIRMRGMIALGAVGLAVAAVVFALRVVGEPATRLPAPGAAPLRLPTPQTDSGFCPAGSSRPSAFPSATAREECVVRREQRRQT